MAKTNIINKVKRQTINWQKICATYITDKGAKPPIYMKRL